MNVIYSFIFVVIIQRLVELAIARKNAIWMKNNGGYEVGGNHYIFLIIIHIGFFISLLAEVTFIGDPALSWKKTTLILFLVAQIGRVWTIASLGRYWNTRIIIVPHAKVIEKGPYRYIRHPNYLVVLIETITLPLIFSAYKTAFIFTIIQTVILYIRIKEEEEALRQVTNYEKVFQKRGRFFPI